MGQGRQTIIKRTVYSDGVMLAISFVHMQGCEIRMLAIGTRNAFRFVDAVATGNVLADDTPTVVSARFDVF